MPADAHNPRPFRLDGRPLPLARLEDVQASRCWFTEQQLHDFTRVLDQVRGEP